MKIIDNKIKNLAIYLFLSLIVAIAVPLFFEKAVTCLFGIILMIFFGIKVYSLLKMKSTNNFFSVGVVCTGKRKDVLNFGFAKYYEFEPLDTEKYQDIIELNIMNEDTQNGIGLKNNQKIRIGYTYTLLFKKQKNGTEIINANSFIGYERCIISD